MKKVTIKAYALKHKLSLFNVMKMQKSGKLKSEVVSEEGKEVIYILLDDETEAEVQKGIVTIEKKIEFKLLEEINILKNEVKILRAEVGVLKKRYN